MVFLVVGLYLGQKQKYIGPNCLISGERGKQLLGCFVILDKESKLVTWEVFLFELFKYLSKVDWVIYVLD